MNILSIGILCSALILVSTAHGNTLESKLANCAKTTDTLARLVCFDTLATSVAANIDTTKDMSSAQLTATPSIVPVPESLIVDTKVATEVKTDQVAMFGAEHLKKSVADKQKNNQITAIVAKVKKNQYDQLLLTFENGQAWKQTDNSWFKLALGQGVILTKGVMGAVYLKKADGSSNKKIRVKRIK